MARARLIAKKICDSQRVNALPLEAQLLFTWLIPHLDKEGRFFGNPKLVNRKVFPLKEYTDEQVDEWLNMLAKAKKGEEGLIERYEVDGHLYISMPGFDSEQSIRGGQAWKSREAPSEIPPPPGTSETNVDSSTIVDERLKKMVEVYEKNIGALTPMLRDRLIDIENEYPDGWFEEAVMEACNNNKRKLNYVTAILERWKVEGKNSKPKPKPKPKDKDKDNPDDWPVR